MMHVIRLDGKVLMVTGATRGIGLATAERLGADGARVVLTARGEDGGRDVEARLRGAGADVVFVPADMTDVARPGRGRRDRGCSLRTAGRRVQ
jgi:NAD(P)-dependent dehydrogenase (short-subunit alcohol dehydrogenase family)